MTVPNRLEALEKGQVDILSRIGDIKADQGEIKGMLREWIDERRISSSAADKRCDDRFGSVTKRLDGHDIVLERHDEALDTFKQSASFRIGQWSTAKLIAAIIAGVVAIVATSIGIIEGIGHLVG